MCRTAGHALGARPFAAASLANAASGFFERGAYKAGIRKGHTGSIAAQLSPSNETLPSELGDADYAFLHPYVLFMFLHDSKQANESEL